MAGQRWWGGGWRMVLGPVVSAVLLAATLTGCGDSTAAGPGGADRTAIQRMLDRRAEAVRERDAGAFLATVDRGARGYLGGQRRVFDNLADVPLRSWTYRLTDTGGFEPIAGSGHRIAAQVELRYRLAGYDSAPVISEQFLTLVRRRGQWYIAGGGRRTAQQLWDQGAVEVVRGEHSLVLGVGHRRDRLRAIARTADRAVPAVNRVWHDRWAGRVVIQVPASLDRMGALLGAPASHYRGIAAVTTGEVGGTGSAPADRVIVNPETYPVLAELGRQVVITHETAHVATRASTTEGTPLWLSEGFADWVGYRDTGRAPRDIAPELTRAVAAGSAPRELPRTADFSFGEDPAALSRAYEEGWLACRMIAERWGERKLVEFYRAVGANPAKDQRASVEAAVSAVLGMAPDRFTAQWRAYVRKVLG